MPMDFREYLLQVENNGEEDCIWSEKSRYIDEESTGSPPGLRRPSSENRIPSSKESSERSFSQSVPRSCSLFGIDNGCLDLYGNSPPTPALRCNPWDIFTAVTSPTKLSFSERRDSSNGVFFDLYDEETSPSNSPPDSPPVTEKTPHLSRLKSLSCPPHWPNKKRQDGDSTDGPKRQVVSFADDFGLPLTSVCIFTDSPNDPPRSMFRRRGTGWSFGSDEGIDLTREDVKSTNGEMEVTFEQPIADFVGFMKKLDSNQVCLENVLMREQRDLVGTIKVKNLAPEKNVSVRVTFNDWQTYCDVPAWFSGNHSATGAKTLYDTFAFSTKVPLSAHNLVFAIRYRVDGQEFWDSNGGVNYRMQRKYY